MATKSKVESTKNVEFAKGGDTPMIPHQAAESVLQNDMAGHTGDPSLKDSTNDKFAKGGSGKMFGFTPSLSAKAGITSAR